MRLSAEQMMNPPAHSCRPKLLLQFQWDGWPNACLVTGIRAFLLVKQGRGWPDKPGAITNAGYFGCSFKAAELMQYRRPLGPGPSSKTWPRWPLHFEHSTSVRIMPWLISCSSSTWLSTAGCEKLGQPQPESNLASDSNRVWPQPAHI